MFSLTDHPHRRYNPLTREWVLVSPHRTRRPWQGQVEPPPPEQRPVYDPHCYLCPGNARANGEVNPHYERTFVFNNDFSALLPDIPSGEYASSSGSPDDAAPPLLYARSERGICRVVCFSPRHDLTLPEMDVTAIAHVIDVWAQEYETIGAMPYIGYVQIFENRGAMMGASNPHPHGQIWATERLPLTIMREDAAQRDYLAATGRSLLADYLALELEREERLVCTNDDFVALVPFWAVWPFETMIISRRHIGAISDLTAHERMGLAGYSETPDYPLR